MIHQRYLEQLASGSNFDEIYPEVRNMFELTSIYASVTPCVNEYISLVYCKKILGYAVDALIEHGWHRYLMLRAAKREVSTQRHMRLRYGYLENGIIDGRKSLNRELYSCSRGDISILSSIAAHIPYNLLIYAMDEISSRITSNMPNVIFFGCEFEADFAIVSHIRKYSRNILPTIYTNDTDLIALLSDIHCIVRMEDGKKTIVVDPARLFSSIFGERMLSSRVIRILCVLQGTDYNPYNAASPIHLQSLTDKGWYMLDEDALLLRVYRVMRRYPESIYIRQTALAMNIYLHGEARLESMLHVLGVGEHVCEKNIDRFLHIVNRNMFV
jgi:hypothetical protein